MQVILEVDWEQHGDHLIRKVHTVTCEDINLAHTIRQALNDVCLGAQWKQGTTADELARLIGWTDEQLDELEAQHSQVSG
jgi:acetyl-CoA acetyltransferase